MPNEKTTEPRALTDAELHALAALAIGDGVEVMAANAQRQVLGQSMAYDGYSSTAYDRLHDELKRRGVL